MSIHTLRLFGVVVDRGTTNKPYVVKEYGVLVSAKAAYAHRAIALYLKENGVGTAERNSAFWQSWQKVANASDFELRVEQLLHYFSTYGLEWFGVDSVKEGLVYLPESVFVSDEPVAMKLIDAVPSSEIVKRCFGLLNSGIALSQETINGVVGALEECDYEITGDEPIRNKEAQALFYKITGKLPNSGDELFRYLIYLFTGQTLVINNPMMREKIVSSGQVLPTLDESRMVTLAESFNRHRDLWIAMKRAHPANRATVNLLTRLSKKYHRPLWQNPLNVLTTGTVSLNELQRVSKSATVFQLVRAHNALALREQEPQGSVYRIRNGKQWTKTIPPVLSGKSEDYREFLLKELSERFKDVSVFVDSFVDYAFPTSEKSFVGSIPDGTVLKFKRGKHNLLIGVHWEDENTDLDFRADAAEFSLGWNTDFRNTSRALMHSGDMTRAPKPYGATEWIYASNLDAAYNLKVNLYRGYDFQKHFKLIIGISNVNPKQGEQIPPKDIVASFDMLMESAQMSIGMLYPDNNNNICLMLGAAGTGKRNVGRYSELDSVQQDVYAKRMVSGLRLKDVFKILSKPKKDSVNLQLSNLTKDAFIELIK